MEAGVYLISNSVNGKCYVGSTIHLDQRRKEHFSRLANNKHVNAHLQNAFNKYGREAFEVLETISIDDDIKEKLLKRLLRRLELSIILFRRDLKTRTSQTITMLSLELYLLKN